MSDGKEKRGILPYFCSIVIVRFENDRYINLFLQRRLVVKTPRGG